jgi:hypothetical protein
MTRITRVEIITDTGRDYVCWEEDNDITVSYQDDGKTLKVFVNTVKPKTPCEIAFKRVYGYFPTEPNWDDDEVRWESFQKGYNASKVIETPQEPEELKTLYQMLNDEECRDDVCYVVKEWMSQYADNVLRGECKKGYEYCLLVLEENLKND